MKKGFLKFLIVISFLLILITPKSVFALTFKVEKSADTIKPGQDVTVYVKSSDIGSDSIKTYNVSLSYDSSKLDLKSVDGNGVSNVTSANPIVVSNNTGTLTDGTTVATIVFTAKKAGDANFTIAGEKATTISDATIEKDKIVWTSSMVKVAALSTDATLSSLKIPNATISPKFDKNTLEYTTTITDITEITVNAVATDSNAKILISDNYKNLQKGDNDIKISVTAEDGKSVRNYLIKVTLKMTPTEEELKKANTKLKKLEVENYDIDFSNEEKKYTLTVPYEITKINILAEAENENATIQMEGNSTLKVGRNVIKVVVISEDEENKDTYTLTVTREKEEKKIVQTCPDTTSKREWIIFSICMFLTFTLGIILGYFLSKKEVLNKLFKKKDKNKDDELSDTIEIVSPNKNDENKMN